MEGIDSRLLESARQTLAVRPAGLITDVDGTISPIAPTPGQATVSAATRRALVLLCERLDVVAAVSGRPAGEARALIGVEGMVYVGNHGLDLWQAGEVVVLPEAAAYVPLIGQALADVAAELGGLPGLLFENKGPTASIHFRLAPAPASARRAIRAALRRSRAAASLRLTEGRRVVELRPPVPADKGTAVLSLIRHAGLRGVVYLGDDVTDVDAFQALRTAADGIRTLAVGVLAQETPPGVRENADAILTGVPAVEALLAALAGVLPPRAPAGRQTDGTATS